MVATPEPTLNDRIHTIAAKAVKDVWERTTELARTHRKSNPNVRQLAMNQLLENLRKELQMSLVKDFGWLSMQVGKKAKQIYEQQLLDQDARISELETQLAETQQRLNNALED